MLMSVIEGAHHAPAYPELAGQRVLISGITSNCGVDIVRAFADHRTRLVLQFAELSEPTETIAEIAAPSALEIKAYGPIDVSGQAALSFARSAVTAFGGLDVIINLVPLSTPSLPEAGTSAEIERLVADRLRLPFLIATVAANRMGLMLSAGLVLNVATLIKPVTRAAQAFASVVKASLSAMTRAQAEQWAGQEMRCNAIAPETTASGAPRLAGEPEIAALALYLASGRGKGLSGHVFEAEPPVDALAQYISHGR